jgi:thiol peroxidase
MYKNTRNAIIKIFNGAPDMQLTFKNEPVQLSGNFVEIDKPIPGFILADIQLQDKSLNDFKEGLLLLNIFPSVDTAVCSDSVRLFNLKAGSFKDCRVLCISKDLPFAQARFCGAENIENVEMLSAFRSLDFGKMYGLEIINTAVKGLLARAVIIVNSDRKVVYSELVQEITNKPNYEACLDAMAKYT